MKKINSGFSFLEILIVLIIIGIITSFVVPKIFKPSFNKIRVNFIADFSNLIDLTVLQAVFNNKVYKIIFEKNKDEDNRWKVSAKVFNDKIESEDFSDKFSDSNFEIIDFPENIELINLFIDEKDQMESITYETFFYINNNGTAQNVKINFLEYRENNKEYIFSLKINPFFARVIN